MQTTVVALAIGILLTIAYCDVRTRRIPNALTTAVALLGLTRLILADDMGVAVHTLIASALVFVASFLLFWRGVFGGGDAKLIGASALLVGSHDLLDFLLIMSVCGGGLGLAIVARDQFHPRRRGASQELAGPPSLRCVEAAAAPVRPTVPYAVAIAGAGIVVLVLRPVL